MKKTEKTTTEKFVDTHYSKAKIKGGKNLDCIFIRVRLILRISKEFRGLFSVFD